MSIGFCLQETRAADWMAIVYLRFLHGVSPLVFIMITALLVLITINWIMNVAVVAITVPVSLFAASHIGLAPDVMLFASLAAAGMPFLLLYGSAPNAIAYGSGQFTSAEFFRAGIPASLLLMAVLGVFIWFIWPLMGMPVLAPH
jgi:sodium-dependent dicarboxylate transporter 2/3/5